MNKKFYITAAIDYVNGAPHIGHAMEKIQADVLARYHRAIGDDVFFLMGTDDNSLKNVQTAEEKCIPIKKLVDQNAKLFFDLQKSLDLSNNCFIRTVEKRHFNATQKIWEACKKDIYKKKYEGLYCVGCEEFKKERDLIEGKCPEHPNRLLEKVEEENYFFRLSAYQKKIEEIIEKDIYKITPLSRKNEALSFIRRGLEDFSISRTKERARGWGIPVPGDDSQIIYVWFDALINYLSALDYSGDQKLFKKYWPADVHVVGKGIMKFHAIYWPAILLSAGIKLPKKLYVHGYVTVDGQKIGKSLGNAIDPQELVKEYGSSSLRYFLLREIPYGKDGDFSIDKFEDRFNADLANDLGNLVQRTISMINKYDIKVIRNEKPLFDKKDNQMILSDKEAIDRDIENLNFKEALDFLWDLISFLNKEIDKRKPWELVKTDKNQLNEFLNGVYVLLFDISEILEPFMPKTSEDMKSQLKTLKPQPLFPKIE